MIQDASEACAASSGFWDNWNAAAMSRWFKGLRRVASRVKWSGVYERG